MNTKILSFVLLFFVSYLLAIFFAPKESDEIAAFLGFEQVNQGIRSLKYSSDNFAETLTNPKANLASGSGNSVIGDVTNSIEIVDGYADTLQNTVKNTKDVIQIKKQQVENLTNTIQK
jgi:gas vesicle protein